MKFFLFLFFTCMGLTAQAQLSIGITGGVNMANWPGEDDVIINNSSRLNLDELLENGQARVLNVDNKSRFAYTVGVQAVYKINSQWSIESGLLYSPQGDRIEGDAIVTVTNPVTGAEVANDVTYIAKSETDYINLPLKAKYSLQSGLAFNFGPQFGYRLNANAITEGYFPADDYTLDYEQSVDDRLKEIDFGAVGGIEYGLENGLGASLEHFLAATQLPKEDRKVHNSVTSLKVFYRFN